MAVRMMSNLPARVITVLQDYLPAELDLIDAEEADSITTADIGAADYHEWDRKLISSFPACTIRTVASTPLQVLMTGMGKRVDVLHRLELMFHETLTNAAGNPLTLQKLLFRYINGAMRVLCIMYPTLQTSGDAVDYAEVVTWAGPAIYGPEAEQEDGSVARTATLPIDVRMIEARG